MEDLVGDRLVQVEPVEEPQALGKPFTECRHVLAGLLGLFERIGVTGTFVLGLALGLSQNIALSFPFHCHPILSFHCLPTSRLALFLASFSSAF